MNILSIIWITAKAIGADLASFKNQTSFIGVNKENENQRKIQFSTLNIQTVKLGNDKRLCRELLKW